MTNEEALAVRDQAVLLFDHIQADLANAATKTEWIRLTQHLSEAERLVQTVDALIV